MNPEVQIYIRNQKLSPYITETYTENQLKLLFEKEELPVEHDLKIIRKTQMSKLYRKYAEILISKQVDNVL